MKNKKLLISIIIVLIVLGSAGWYFYGQKAIVWDGTYQMTGNLACEGNIPNLTSIPMSTTVSVVSNKIIDQQTGKIFAISKDGKVKETIDLDSSGVKTSASVDYQFYQEKGVNKFSANGSVILSTSQGGKDYSSICTGNPSGVIL